MNTTASPVALITGAGRDRIGNHVARDLAAAGYRVAIHYNSSKEGALATVDELSQQGHEAKAFQADVGDSDAVDKLAEDVITAFGRIDLLVCTASVWPVTKLEETTVDDIWNAFRVDALGSFLCARRFGLLMTGQETGGSIVLFGDWALERPYLDHAAYFLAKGTIPTMTKMLARELAERNPRVRVNAILPGPVLLPDHLSEAEREQTREATLLKVVSQPAAVTHTVLYFANNPMLTGAIVPVDAGRTIHAPD